ncbi:major facilitator superfamily transporter [Niveomyces insectorum RCEF 264]|uniref:Major facilitator superfamily transporter n=1 Tax=Niveomyces insectorum RCEF 264 TaxID=1081102 RepID=A0A168ABC9_9HYPO|nr:major facilitator superfamily transporter [Niveomyces insectorum RCEF 264]
MHEKAVHRARIVSSVAATVISLACGTNYVYSAWAPQFADKLLLSATQSNLIGLAGNLGMYSMGVPIGMFVDHRGSRPAVIAGALLLGLGYFPLRQAYDAGAGSVTLLCIYSYLTGLGGCMAFAAAVKTSALNWPHHRGTATAFPLAAFGLSAFFFSLCGSLLVPGNTSAFLLLLAVGTFGFTFVGFFFLRVLPHAPHSAAAYHAVPPLAGDDDTGDVNDSRELRRTLSEELRTSRATAANGGRRGRYQHTDEPGRLSDHDADAVHTDGRGEGERDGDGNGDGDGEAEAEAAAASGRTAAATHNGTSSKNGPSRPAPQALPSGYSTISAHDAAASASASASAGSPSVPFVPDDADANSVDETSSLMSKASSHPGDVLLQNSVDLDRSHRVDIRGWKLLRNVDNIGHDANALWKHYDDSVDENFLVTHQQMHVSILSVGSFAGRLLSGVGSDFLVKKLHASRVWCLVVAAIVFVGAQVCAINIANPHFLGLVSSLSGLGYGFLFGVYPSIVAEAFGIHGLSQNWGFMTLSPVLSGNVFNLFYGLVYDHHSIVEPSGERSCDEGLACYRAAYIVTLAACGLGLAVPLFVIRHQYWQREKEAGKRSLED